ncbi:MAG: CHASE2 domain-containing protein [Candidatus Electrothrix sp. YB6]
MFFGSRKKYGSGSAHLAGLLLILICLFISLYRDSNFLKNKLGPLEGTLEDILLPLDTLRLKTFDLFLRLRPAPLLENRVVIVDIDSASLGQHGQWPWSRNQIAELLNKITAAGPAVVGFDILFAEPDRSSPKISGYDVSFADLSLAKAMYNSPAPVILGYAFTDPEVPAENHTPETGNFVFEGGNPAPFLHPFTGADVNLEILETAAQGSGSFNIVPDHDSIIRNLPLLVYYRQQVYPSLVLSMLQAAEGNGQTVTVKMDQEVRESGIRYVQAGPYQYQIPTTMHGELIVYFSGPARTFPYISAHDILSDNFDPAVLRNAYVLIGISAPGLFDLRAVPTDRVFPGVEVHANALNTILSRNFLQRPEWAKGAEMIYLLCISLVSFLLLPKIKATSGVFLSLAIFVGIILLSLYSFYYQNILIDITYPVIITGVLFTFFTSYNFFAEEKKTHQLRSAFSHYLSPDVVRELVEKKDRLVLDGEERELTILFSDIRNFTAMAEKMSPDNLCSFLNQYMTPMTGAIMERRGTVDKFIGDAIMAFWNAPLDTPNHLQLACDCALSMLRELAELNRNWQKEGLSEVQIGIGLHFGQARVGNMGSQHRFDYTVIGDTVNLASRLEGLTKLYGVNILVSDAVARAMAQENAFFFRQIDTVRVLGKKTPVTLYQLLAADVISAAMRQELRSHKQALTVYTAGDFQAAFSAFQKLQDRSPNDRLYSVYLERCRQLAAEPPAHWDGITDLHVKG